MSRITSILIILFLVINQLEIFGQPKTVKVSPEEIKLYELIMKYRAENGLKKIPLSKSLTFVAQTHAIDLDENEPENGRCNMHSWSDKGKWSACCYTDDHANAKCMWNKPRELTSYSGNGYEIAHWRTPNLTAEGALEGWQNSKGHNDVITNKSIWKKIEWKAVGIGMYGKYAVVWFGEEPDKEGEPAR